MAGLRYHRPKSLDQALQLLKAGVPLGGGTALTPRRRELTEVVDLQDLDLDTLDVGEKSLTLGAGLSLQRLMEASDAIPRILHETCRLEAGWNLRGQASLAGAIVAGDGRSPLLMALLALDARLRLEPGGDHEHLDEWLDDRGMDPERRLITAVELRLPEAAEFAQVARSPADRPIVCAAVALDGGEGSVRIALGGYGDRPLRVLEAEQALKPARGTDPGGGDVDPAIERASQAAGEAYARADDEWASGEYRGEIAAVLVARLLHRLLG